MEKINRDRNIKRQLFPSFVANKDIQKPLDRKQRIVFSRSEIFRNISSESREIGRKLRNFMLSTETFLLKVEGKNINNLPVWACEESMLGLHFACLPLILAFENPSLVKNLLIDILAGKKNRKDASSVKESLKSRSGFVNFVSAFLVFPQSKIAHRKKMANCLDRVSAQV